MQQNLEENEQNWRRFYLRIGRTPVKNKRERRFDIKDIKVVFAEAGIDVADTVVDRVAKVTPTQKLVKM